MRRLYLAAEFVVLFIVLPLGFAWAVRYGRVPRGIFAALWVFAAVCLAWLLLDKRFDRRVFVRTANFRGHMRVVLARFIGAAVVLTAVVAMLWPEQLLGFPRHRPGWWAVVMLLYPVLSVYPQGIIYRAFVFHRYRPLVGGGLGMVALSAVAFTLCHAVFANAVALALTAVGGVLFAWTYWKSRSLTIAWIEHALYGCMVITVGLGRYIYLPRV